MVIVQVAGPEGKVAVMAQKADGPAHTKRPCRHHIVSAPKYRRKAACNRCRKDLGEILRQLCRWKGVEAIEGHLMLDHVHMPAGIPPKISVSSFMGYLKGEGPPPMLDGRAGIKYRFGNRKFWAEGYYVPAVGPDEATAAKHMREQGRAYIARDGPGVKGCGDPFARGPQGR